jgi:hypothetical protein
MTESKARAVVQMALGNIEAVFGPLINPINDYGDMHPSFELAYIEQPAVREWGEFDPSEEDRFPPFYGLIEAKPAPSGRERSVTVVIRPLLRNGRLGWTCDGCGESKVPTDDGNRVVRVASDGQEPCHHALTLILHWRKKMKEAAEKEREGVSRDAPQP